MLTASRTEKPWLAEVDRQIQTQALRDLESAYQNFFKKRAKFPRFKSRHGPQSVRFVFDHRHTGKTRAWAKRILVLPGIGECRIADSLEAWPQKARAGDRAARCGVATTGSAYATEAPALEAAPDRMIGVDVGITDLAVTSDGWKSGQLTRLKDKAAQLRRYQRQISRRVKGSNRRDDGQATARAAPSPHRGCPPGLHPQDQLSYCSQCKRGRDRNASM